MKKIPSLFLRDFENNPALVTRNVNPDAAWVVDDNANAKPTRKRDGTACMFRDRKLFRRYDCKHGKTPPPGFEPCQEPDPNTGHWPGWVPIGAGPADQWYRHALCEYGDHTVADGTYELCGPKFQTNAENLRDHIFFRHGAEVFVDVPTDFDGLKAWLSDHPVEGVVWHHIVDGRMAKAKRCDFGLDWPIAVDLP